MHQSSPVVLFELTRNGIRLTKSGFFQFLLTAARDITPRTMTAANAAGESEMTANAKAKNAMRANAFL